MSLAIDVDRVRRVLLADGWHTVTDDSFYLDSYEYLWYGEDPRDKSDPMVLQGGGSGGVCPVGFRFLSEGSLFMGPLTAIQAVQYATVVEVERGKR